MLPGIQLHGCRLAASTSCLLLLHQPRCSFSPATLVASVSILQGLCSRQSDPGQFPCSFPAASRHVHRSVPSASTQLPAASCGFRPRHTSAQGSPLSPIPPQHTHPPHTKPLIPHINFPFTPFNQLACLTNCPYTVHPNTCLLRVVSYLSDNLSYPLAPFPLPLSCPPPRPRERRQQCRPTPCQQQRLQNAMLTPQAKLLRPKPLPPSPSSLCPLRPWG